MAIYVFFYQLIFIINLKTMKKYILPLILFFGISLNSCKKETIVPTPDSYELLIDEQPSSLVDELGINLFDPYMIEITPSADAVITDYPAFIDYDPFTTVTLRGGVDSCLFGISVTKAEKEKLTVLFNNKLDCQKANKELISKIHRDMELWVKNEKASLYKTYMYNRELAKKMLTDGKITEAQYKDKIAYLEKKYSDDLKTLNATLKNKIQSSIDKMTAIGKIKDCEKFYLNGVMELLGKQRFKLWIECYKKFYKSKK
jgi:hypothetical protein